MIDSSRMGEIRHYCECICASAYPNSDVCVESSDLSLYMSDCTLDIVEDYDDRVTSANQGMKKGDFLEEVQILPFHYCEDRQK